MEQPSQPECGSERADAPEERERDRHDGPRIYVASLSDYNAGILHGTWLAADQPPDELHAGVLEMLARSPTDDAEEFAIHDFEGFSHYPVHEYDSLDWISRVARGIVEQGPAFSAWAEQSDHDDETLRGFEDVYLGEWGSVEE